MRKNQLTCVIAVLAPAPETAIEVRFSSRDWKLLQEDYLPGSASFLNEFGFVGITSVADGLRFGQTVDRRRGSALLTAENLWSTIEPQLTLLSSDYVCEPQKRPEPRRLPVMVSRYLGNVRSGSNNYAIEMPPGQCRLETTPTLLEEFDPVLAKVCVRPIRHPVEDLRRKPTFTSDNYGLIKIRKRHRGTAWGVVLPELIDALRNPRMPENIQIYNAHR